MKRLLVCMCMLIAGCHAFTGDYPRSVSIVPAGKLQVFPRYGIAYADMVSIMGVAALVYQVTDPMAPAWEITETRLADNRVLYAMKMQNLHAGGEGEARYILTRRAEALAQELGMGGYELRRYEEAIDSRLFLPHRTATAEIRLIAAGQP